MDQSDFPSVAGLPAKGLRDLLRELQDEYFEMADVETLLGRSRRETEIILRSMVDWGLIEPQTDYNGRGSYAVSDLGTRVASSHFAKRITRRTADRLLAGVLTRANAINHEEGLTHRVTLIRVFGSYLSDAATLGDIDLLATLEPTTEDWVKLSIRRAHASGKIFSNFGQQLLYGRAEVVRKLKNRSPYISIHTGDEIERFSLACEVVFQLK